MGGIIYDVGWLRVSGGMENQLTVIPDVHRDYQLGEKIFGMRLKKIL